MNAAGGAAMRNDTRTFTLATATLALTLIAGSFALSQEGSQPATPPAAEDSGQTASFTLATGFVQGKFVYIGVGGDIDEVVNPELRVPEGVTVEITLVNGDGMEHDIVLGDLDID